MYLPLNKKQPLHLGAPDCEALARLSKFALLDLLTEALRANAGHCDTPCSIKEVREFCAPTLAARGDRPI